MLRILLVVVAFLMLLGLAAYFTLARSLEAGKVAAAQAQIKILSNAADLYRLNHNAPPDKLEVLLKPDPVNDGAPYFKDAKALIDPWGQPFQYEPAGIKGKTVGSAIWTVTPNKVMIGNWVEPKP